MPLIEPLVLPTWRALQASVARVMRECGMRAETEVLVATVRGTAEVDVVATDLQDVHQTRICVECKHWTKRVPRTVVHAFRSVVADSGSHVGLIVSKAGFQPGAIAAAGTSNVSLLTWEEFQAKYVARWYDYAFRHVIDETSESLSEYTEPLNGWVASAAHALRPVERARYAALATRYWPLALFARTACLQDAMLEIPLRGTKYEQLGLSNSILYASTLRELRSALIAELREGTTVMNELFGN
jgi:restriction system protein